MSPFGFVNWRSAHARFCVLMWLLAAVLAIAVLVRTSHASVGHHQPVAANREIMK